MIHKTSSTSRLIFIALSFIFAVSLLGLTACGSGGGGGGNGTTTTISGKVVKGPVSNGSVEILGKEDGTVGGGNFTYLSNVVSTAANGSYSNSDETIPVHIIVVVARDGSYVDEATKKVKNITYLAAAVADVDTGSHIKVNITPLTTLATELAKYGGKTITEANQLVGAYFGGIDILNTDPIDPLIPNSAIGATQEAINYGLILAGLSQEAMTLGLDPMTLIAALIEDFEWDGNFDGMLILRDGKRVPVTLTGHPINPATGTTMLAASIEAFSNDPQRNVSGGSVSPSLITKLRNGGDNGGTATFSVQSDATKHPPLRTITLTLSSVGAASVGASPKFSVQMDLSGLNTFASSNTIDVPGQFSAGKVFVTAPILEFYRGKSNVNSKFSLRVKRESDGAMSNILSFDYLPISIPANKRGIPSTVLDLFVRAMLEKASPALGGQISTIRPGFIADSAIILGVDTTIADIQAEAILRELFGVSAIGASIPSSKVVGLDTNGYSGSNRALREAPATLYALAPVESIKSGMLDMLNCVSTSMDNFISSERAGIDCLDVALIAVRDKIVTGFTDLTSHVAGIGSVLTSLTRLGTETLVGGYVGRMVISSEMTEYAGEFAQLALTTMGATANPGDTADFVVDKLTEYGKRKIYDHLTRNLPEIDQNLLEIVGTPDAFNEIIDFSADKVARLNGLENSLLRVDAIAESLQTHASSFGGPSDSDSGSAPSEIPLGGFGSVPIGPDVTSPATACAQFPEIGTAVSALGFASCEAYMAPFFDKAFLESTINPLLDHIPFAQLEACIATPLSPSCEALFNQMQSVLDELFARLKEYEAKDFHCDGGYSEYDTNSGTRTCIFSQLDYSPAGQCFAGSRPSPFDVGASNVCVYFSRDYLRNGGCRQNYSKVFFLGTDRCRWSTLPVSKPAAYSVNKTSGDQFTLEP